MACGCCGGSRAARASAASSRVAITGSPFAAWASRAWTSYRSSVNTEIKTSPVRCDTDRAGDRRVMPATPVTARVTRNSSLLARCRR